MTDPAGELYELPTAVQFDPRTAASLAVLTEIEKQAGKSGGMIAVDPGPIVQAVWDLDERGDVPRVPHWDDGTTPADKLPRIRRAIGGGTPAGHSRPQPTVEAWVGTEGGVIGFDVTMAVENGETDGRGVLRIVDVTQQIWVPAADAETWALAVLGGVHRARELAAEQPPPFDVVAADEDEQAADPHPMIVTLPGTAYAALQNGPYPQDEPERWQRLTERGLRSSVGRNGARWRLAADAADWRHLRDYLQEHGTSTPVAAALARIDSALADTPGA